MKKLIIATIIIAIIAGCAGPSKENRTEYNIEGTVNDSLMAWIYLKKRQEGKWVTVDSVIIKDQKFSFTGVINFPDYYYLQIPLAKTLVPFFIEASDIKIDIDLDSIDNTKIMGSRSNELYESYLDELDAFDRRIRSLVQDYRNAKQENNEALVTELDIEIDGLYGEKEKFVENYIYEHNSSVIAPFIAYRNAYQFELDALENIADTLDESLSPSLYYKFLVNRVNVLKRVDIGQPFMPFQMPDTSGSLVSLSEVLDDNYLLIDFWASWCGPCRAENPNLVSCYYDFKDKGFEILGVSLDNNREEWIRAIHEDNLTWYHVSDLMGWKSSAGQLYGIMAIPSNLLIDPSGTIIAKELRGERLRKKLEEIFGES